MQLKTIKARLQKLAKEREQLLQYQRLDKKRKAIEYCILDHDRLKILQELKNVRRLCSLQHDNHFGLLAFFRTPRCECNVVLSCI